MSHFRQKPTKRPKPMVNLAENTTRKVMLTFLSPIKLYKQPKYWVFPWYVCHCVLLKSYSTWLGFRCASPSSKEKRPVHAGSSSQARVHCICWAPCTTPTTNSISPTHTPTEWGSLHTQTAGNCSSWRMWGGDLCKAPPTYQGNSFT